MCVLANTAFFSVITAIVLPRGTDFEMKWPIHTWHTWQLKASLPQEDPDCTAMTKMMLPFHLFRKQHHERQCTLRVTWLFKSQRLISWKTLITSCWGLEYLPRPAVSSSTQAEDSYSPCSTTISHQSPQLMSAVMTVSGIVWYICIYFNFQWIHLPGKLLYASVRSCITAREKKSSKCL